MKKVIIIGATSGIGEALAIHMASNGLHVGITGRREERLQAIHDRFPQTTYCKPMDVSQHPQAIERLHELIDEMGGMDIIVINAGIGIINPELKWEWEEQIIDVNVKGFAVLAGAAMNYFLQQNTGHLVGISSIAALRGIAACPAYNASKAFVSNYLQGLRQKAIKLGAPIHVTDIQPGFVDTPMTQGQEGMFWVASPEKAAYQIYTAILRKRKQAYITKRWCLIAWLMKTLPDSIFNRL